MRLPDSLREYVRLPLGTLLPQGSDGVDEIKSHIPCEAYVITVGDKTTEKMIDLGIIPSLQIVDGMEQRKQRSPPKISDATYLEAVNPAAEITLQSIDAIKTAFSLPPPIRLFIHGEEDLLVIPACIYAPANAIILYGQPNQGLVIVNVSDDTKSRMHALLDMME